MILAIKRIKKTSLIVCGFTNGNLILYKASNEGLLIVEKHQAHQLGVNCLDTVTSEAGIIVASGGDDQQIAISKFTKEGLFIESFKVLAHSSCIKGICAYLKDQELWLASSGYD